MRILHAARNIANQPWYMVKALRKLGHEAELWEFGTSPFGFPSDRSIDISDKDPRVLWNTFLEALDRFDVFHFHFGRSFFPNHWGGVQPFWDLPIYRILDKKVFFTFHGSDCRIKRMHLEINPWSYYKYSDIDADDDRTEKAIQVIRTYANKMFVVSVDYLPFVPEAEVVPRVIDLDEWPAQQAEQRVAPTILHVPSHKGTKGTHFIAEGMRKLEDEGVKFEFRLLHGVSHDEARKAIQSADIVIDNAITGDYELVSLEAMASNRVAVANMQQRALEMFPNAPVYGVDPNDFTDRMRALIGDVDLRRSLAARGRDYVAEVHDTPVIGRTLLDYYERPSPAVTSRAFPDWTSLESRRRIELLERDVFRKEQDVARLRVRENQLRRRLGKSGRRDLKDLVPDSMRVRLRRLRAEARKRTPYKVRRAILQMQDRRLKRHSDDKGKSR